MVMTTQIASLCVFYSSHFNYQLLIYFYRIKQSKNKDCPERQELLILLNKVLFPLPKASCLLLACFLLWTAITYFKKWNLNSCSLFFVVSPKRFQCSLASFTCASWSQMMPLPIPTEDDALFSCTTCFAKNKANLHKYLLLSMEISFIIGNWSAFQWKCVESRNHRFWTRL